MTFQPASHLDDLSSLYPLPISGSELETFSDTAIVSGVSIHLAGFATEFDGECITGSAAALDEMPLFRAHMELVERLSLLLAMRRGEPILLRDASGARVGLAPVSHVFPDNTDPHRWKWARSNGVAVAASWGDAARRARWELIERDRVLRSFYGEMTPRVVDDAERMPGALFGDYGFQTYAFGASDPDGVHTAGVFGFPRGNFPLVYGFGARPTLDAAVAAARSECLQRLGFLFGEAIPEVSPAASPTPDFHQEYFLYPGHHETLRKWLCGEHARYRGCLNESYARVPAEPLYADLTPATLERRLCVARALPRGHVPLAFGVGLPMLAPPAPMSVAVHPIA
jgi:hypothetical protein